MDVALVSNERPHADEAVALWQAWTEDRDVKARDRLVLSYAPMVKYLACRKARELPTHCELDDLVSCGLVALIAAIDRFDPSKGSFESYAWTRVSGAMIDELRAQDWAPRSVRRSAREIERARDKVQARTGGSVTDDELAAELKVGLDELRECFARLDRADVQSLNHVARGHEDSSIEVIDLLEALPGFGDPEGSALANERSRVLRKAMSRLSERDRQILMMLYVWEMPGAEVGRVLGISESRVSQIVSSVRCRLRQPIEVYDASHQRNAA